MSHKEILSSQKTEKGYSDREQMDKQGWNREREEEMEVVITVRTVKTVRAARMRVQRDVNQVDSTGTSGHK